jgi:hypothetical protein
MKQKKSNWHIAKVVIRNLARLFWAIVCYLAVEARFKVKFLAQDISAMMAGFKNHAAVIQKELDLRHMQITLEKQLY